MIQAPFLPPEAPLGMKAQSLQARPGRSARPMTAPTLIGLRRLLVIGSAIALTLAAAREMYLVLNGAGPSLLGIVVLLLFVVLFAWIALAFTSAVAGFVSLLGHGGLSLGITRDGPLPELSARTALLMPTYNENPARVMAGLQAIIESLAATGRLGAFDVFVLSDTTNADVWIAEEAAFLSLRERLRVQARVFYRRRAKNTERKAGNIADWVRRFGGAYPQMMTLDADSVMDGGTIVRLAGAMERHPGVALIQTLPVIVNGNTLFARMQQFAGRVYGPMIAYGIAWWHGSEGNYWGHNAIIRTRAFAEQAGLPTLPGRKPFGGHILSHDFVEAALMRRAGWAIHMVPGLPGSYEESPPSLTDIAIRDRRWCQGNLQHAKVLPARGLHWVSRLHLMMGIGSYVTSPLWLVFLLCGIAISVQSHFLRPEYFGATKSLFPNWPRVDPVLARYVFIGTMAILLAPKLFAWIALLFDRQARRGSGGALRSLLSVLIETLVGGLVAPIAMLIQTGGVLSILAGRDSGWNAQRRDDGRVPWREVWRGYWRHMLFGLVLTAIAWTVSPALFLWMTPVLLGLVLAVPLAAITADRAPGLGLARLGLLRIPEEVATPPILARANALARELEATIPADPLEALLRDPALLAAHRAMLPPPRRRGEGAPEADLLVGLAKLSDADTLPAALAGLSARERAAVLGDAGGLDRLLALHRVASAALV
ncbi:glucans biosynthesis glucosyltransferase MdoH [Lichenicoccus roseus]|uniref:Glucans biosynthesis glucosyltransferase H n=1 Tax=Lichenicoccus roseus TaxID=2683649 RepID=A0A5R9J3Z3_9PROT|nr:glucans biosynthesis glucosyltransferase MdoH [Lichenicoccus roseus]TLU72340.1 glucans biosynthesis glucosyltransferase MdoH [Lichenicoccus roseus]